MSAPVVSTPGAPVPFITVAQLKRSPIFGQLQQLVPNSSDADRDAELLRIIRRISAMINSEVRQNLCATVDTEQGQVVVTDGGELRIHTASSPIVQLLSVEVGWDLRNLTAIADLSGAMFEPWRITIPDCDRYGRRGQRLWARWTYINGYPVTLTAAASHAGDTTLVVNDATGIVPNETLLTVEDGKLLETVVPTAVSGNTLTVPAMEFPHQAGVGVHALPDDIQEAVLMLVSRLHDTWSLSMGAITMDGSGAKVPGAHVVRAMCDAAWMLNAYKRRW